MPVVNRPETKTDPPHKKPGRIPVEPYKHRTGSDRKPLPSELEQAEGAAWLVAKRNLNESTYDAWVAAAFALMRQQPKPCVSRCPSCGVRAFGRSLAEDGCSCGYRGPSAELLGNSLEGKALCP